MFPILAILCFLLVLFQAPITWNLMALGLAFLAATWLTGTWPLRIPPRG